jgi:hypothetical protein
MDDEFWRVLPKETGIPEGVIDVIEMIDTYRNAAELLLNAPYGSLRIVDVDALLNNYRAAQACVTGKNKEDKGI